VATRGKGVRIPLRLDKSQAEKDGRELAKDLASSLVPVVDVVALAKAGYEALKNAISGAVEIGKEAIAAASAQETAEYRLTAALARHGPVAEDFLARLNEQNFARQQSMAISDDAQLQIQASAALLDVEAEHLDLVTRATIGLAETTGQSLDSALRTVAKAYHGNTSALKKYGIQAEDADSALQSLADRMVVAEARAGTYAGRVDLLRENWSELYETLGDNIVRNEDVKKLLKDTNTVLLEMIDYLKKDGPTIKSFVSDFVQGLRDLSTWVKENKSELVFLTKFFGGFIGKDPFTATYSAMGDALGQIFGGNEKPGPEVFDFGEEGSTVKSDGVVDFVGTTFTVDPAKMRAKKQKADKDAAERRHQDLIASVTPIIDVWRLEAKANIEHLQTTENLQKQEIEARAEFNNSFTDLETQRLVADREAIDERTRIRLHGFSSQQELQAAELASMKEFGDQLGLIALSNAANFTGSMAYGLLSGKEKVKDAGTAALGMLVGVVGDAMLVIGAAATAAGVGSTAVPFLIPIFGGPAGIVAGGLITAAGAGLKAWSGDISASARSTTSSAPRGGFRTPDSFGPGTFERSTQRPGGGGSFMGGNIINVILPDGLLVGSTDELARMLADLLAGQAELRLS
jgi:hypothetical protein